MIGNYGVTTTLIQTAPSAAAPTSVPVLRIDSSGNIVGMGGSRRAQDIAAGGVLQFTSDSGSVVKIEGFDTSTAISKFLARAKLADSYKPAPAPAPKPAPTYYAPAPTNQPAAEIIPLDATGTAVSGGPTTSIAPWLGVAALVLLPVGYWLYNRGERR